MSIPISQVVSVTPSVLAAGGGLDHLTGCIITTNTTVVPDQTVTSYSSAAAVGTAFGTTSTEYEMAVAYFAGTTIAAMQPASLVFAGLGSTDTLGAAYLTTVAALTTFSGITTAFAPTQAVMEAVAQWVGAQNDTVWYPAWDQSSDATTSGGSGSFGVWLADQALNGTTVLYGDATIAAGAMGWMASLDFDATNGRASLFGRTNSELTPSVTSAGTADILAANGYSFYGQFGGAAGSFNMFSNGAVSGAFAWADSYVNQIWLNNNLQYDLMELLNEVGQIPFTTRGDTLIAAALAGTISQALAFGAITAGVTLTSLQQQIVNSAAGNATAATTLATVGWYLIPGASKASASVRDARGPVTPVLYYCDGESVQSINLSSVEVQ